MLKVYLSAIALALAFLIFGSCIGFLGGVLLDTLHSAQGVDAIGTFVGFACAGTWYVINISEYLYEMRRFFNVTT